MASAESGKARIAAAARDLFVANGFHQTAVAELASAAKVSVGQVYRLFENKDDIILAIVRDQTAADVAVVDGIAADLEAGAFPPVAALEKLFAFSMAHGSENLSFEILAEAHRNPRVAESLGGLCQHYRQALRRFAQAINPALSDAALDAAEEILLACVFGLGHRSHSRPRLSVEQTASRAARMILISLEDEPT